MSINGKILQVALLSFLMPTNPLATPAVPKIAPRTFEIAGEMIPGHEPDGNTYILESIKELTVIDTGRHESHRRKIETFAEKKNTAIVAVINSHRHLDHVSGNIELRQAYPGIKVYASGAINDALTGFLAKNAESSRQMLATGKLDPVERDEITTDLATIDAGEALKPDVILSHSEVLTIGRHKLQIHVAKNAVTAGDVWVFDPSSGVLFVGDLVTFRHRFSMPLALLAGRKPLKKLHTYRSASSRRAMDRFSRENISRPSPRLSRNSSPARIRLILRFNAQQIGLIRSPGSEK
ncbi:MAG: hypothetical protein JWQ49_860 [Edaphobacter sp.]|nr:hypothetical protein [Edaphobacter sp.]